MFARYATKALFATAAVAATLVFVVSPASAQAFQTYTRAVSYADLDLKSDSDIDRLRSRIRGAARYVCGPAASGAYAEQANVMNCRSRAVANANRSVVTVLAALNAGDQLALRSGSITVSAD